MPANIRQAARLTRYAVVTRYPGLAEPATTDEYEEAVVIAEDVLDWVEAIVKT